MLTGARNSLKMHTALDAPTDVLDQAEQFFVKKIRECGWFRTLVFSETEEPDFSYTTGFWVTALQPELIIFGLKKEIAHDVLWDMFRKAQAGLSLPIGKRTDEVFGNLPAYVFTVAKRHYADHLGWSRWFYGGSDFTCLQIVWPDRAGLFPWQDGFDPAFKAHQPDLTEKGWVAALAH